MYNGNLDWKPVLERNFCVFSGYKKVILKASKEKNLGWDLTKHYVLHHVFIKYFVTNPKDCMDSSNFMTGAVTL